MKINTSTLPFPFMKWKGYYFKVEMKPFFPTILTLIILLRYPILGISSGSTLDLPKCSDLSDSTDRFYVELLSDVKSCEWARRTDTWWRCFRYTEVETNCPQTCEVKCSSDEPSQSPSLSPSPTTAPTDFPFCEDLEDVDVKFYVEGTAGNEMRSCDWVKRRNTSSRCQIEVARQNCAVVCNTPCRNRNYSPSIAPTTADLNIGGINEIIQTDNRSVRRRRILIGCGVGGALLIVGIAFYLTQSSRTKRSVTYDVKEENIFDDDDQLALQSLGSRSADTKVSALHAVQPPSITKTSSYIPANQKNLGAHHSVKDVQCCGNFPCENCRMENNLTFIRVSSWKKFRSMRLFSVGEKGVPSAYCEPTLSGLGTSSSVCSSKL